MRYEDDDAEPSPSDEEELDLIVFREQLERETAYYEAAQDADDWPLAHRLQQHVRRLGELVAHREERYARAVAGKPND